MGDLTEMLEQWEGYDPTLSTQENLIELQISLGCLDEALKVCQTCLKNS